MPANPPPCAVLQPPSGLSNEERTTISQQAAKLEEQAQKDGSATEALAGAAGSYAVLGDLGKSAVLLEQLTAVEPKNSSAWQALVCIHLPGC